MSQPTAATILNEVIQQRRSVKTNAFRPGEKIPDAIIRQALENATWAPNHGKIEPWHFIVYSGAAIQRLSDFQAVTYKQESGEKFTEAKFKKLKDGYQSASHVIAICYKKDPASAIPEIENIAAVACAVQNLALTLHAYGYGGYWTTGGVTYYESAKPFFNLDEGDKLLGFYLCGVPAYQPAAIPRKPMEEKTSWFER